MQKKTMSISSLLILTIALPAARAGITSTTGAAQQLPAPPDVTTGELESDTIIYAFQERSGQTAQQAISADITSPGTVPGPSGNNLSPGSIPQGAPINSYYIHYDKIGGSNAARSATGSITFGEDVLGLIVRLGALTATNATLGAPGTTYPTGSAQDIELNDGTMITLSADRRTVTVTLRVTCCADNIRVITGNLASPVVPPPQTGVPGTLLTGSPVNLCGSCGTGLATMMPVFLMAWVSAKRHRRHLIDFSRTPVTLPRGETQPVMNRSDATNSSTRGAAQRE